MSKRRRPLSSEDQELWDKVKGSTTPMHPATKPAQVFAKPDPKPAAPKPMDPPLTPSPFKIGAKSRAGALGHSLTPSLLDSLANAPVQMDRKNYTRMKRGKLVPDARIDLHGLTLGQAHPRLTGFVLRCHAEGLRLLLVITGKGKRKPDEGPIPTQQGVLRHQVPQWLSMAPLGGVVLQVTPAHQSHGGSGAYYVYLRRNR